MAENAEFQQKAFRQITCILYQRGVEEFLKKLHARGISRTVAFVARGKVIGEPHDHGEFRFDMPKEVLMAMVEEELAEETFEWLYHEARIGEPGQGFLSMSLSVQLGGDSLSPDILSEE